MSTKKAIASQQQNTIVVVDDDPAKRYSVTRILQHAGFSVVEAATGRDALKAARDQPSLIMLDIRLPDMMGYEVCKEIKKDVLTASIPVLLLSASFTASEHKVLGLNIGADGYLTHPVETNVLVATVRSLLRLHQAETEARASAAELDEAYRAQKRIAETLQRSLLIDVMEESLCGLKVASFYEAAWDEASVGGDFYDAFNMPDDKVALVVGDATGKGLAAAVRTAEVKFALRAYLHEHKDPARALMQLNDFLCYAAPDNASDAIVAAAVGVVDTRSHLAIFAAAGAEAPLILGKDMSARSANTTGLPLGAFPGVEYTAVSMTFAPGDTILSATDGITEARQGKKFLSYEGMVELAKQHLGSSHSIQEEGQAMLDAARSFTGGSFQDDVCILLARYE